MADPQVSNNTAEALLVFADIIDSSKFSSVLGFKKYAERVIKFQQLFKTLGQRYFPDVMDKTTSFNRVDSRGDEGVIFHLEPSNSNKRAEWIFSAIEFLYHLKGRLYFEHDNDNAEFPVRMGLGAGVHVGTVAFATNVIDYHSEITQIEGFSINKAKRVESSSRGGIFSRIIVSDEAARLLEGQPVLLYPISSSMKGIEEKATLYEVRSGLFSGLRIDADDEGDKILINSVEKLAKMPIKIDEDWLKSLIVSIFDIKLRNAFAREHKARYRDAQLNFAWGSTCEDDPILLYLRALDYREQCEYTQQIRYLKNILDKYPDFTFAKIEMVKACWKIASQNSERVEKIYARDVAKEILNRFPHLLTREEKENFVKIINEIMPSNNK
jgi:hypothetical protein